MPDIHLSRDLLIAYARGRISHPEFAQLALEHLSRFCPHCREEIQSWQTLEEGQGSFVPSLVFAMAHLSENLPALAAESRQAEKDLQALLQLPAAERQGRVQRARKRFRSLRLVELLIEAGRERLHDDPEETKDLLRLSLEVLGRLPLQRGRTMELMMRVHGQLGNTYRVLGTLPKAEEYFATARGLVLKGGITDSLLLAELDSLEGSLRRAQRRFGLAETLLKRSVLLYDLRGADARTARVLIKLGAMYSDAFEDGKAIATTQRGLTLLDPERDARLVLCGRHNIAWSLCNLGRFAEAEGIFQESGELYRRFPDPWTVCRCHWLGARIAAGLSRLEEADQGYEAAREGFIRHGYGYDVALVTLDHATLYLQQGRTADLRQLAEELTVVFSAQEVHREATAALLLFQQAARQEAVNHGLLFRLSRYLLEARRRPDLRFRPVRRKVSS